MTGIVWEDDIQWEDDIPALRAGTGSFGTDILQDLINIGLPEQYAAPLIQELNEGSTVEPDGDGGFLLVRKDGSKHDLNRTGINLFDERSSFSIPSTNLDYENQRDPQSGRTQTADVSLPLGEDALKLYSALAQGGGAAEVGKRAFPKIGEKVAKWAYSNPAKSGGLAGMLFSLYEQGLGEAATAPLPGENPDFSVMEVLGSGLFGSVPGTVVNTAKGAGNLLSDLTGIQAFSRPFERLKSASEARNTPEGELTPRAKEALEAAGYNINGLTPDEIAKANDSVARNVRLDMMPRGTKAAFDMNDIEATEGMIFQNPEIIKREVSSPERAGAVLSLQNQGREFASPSNLEGVRNDVLTLHQIEERAANQAFDTARNLGDAPVQGQRLGDIKTNIEANLRKVYGEDHDVVDEVMKRFPEFKKGRGSSGILDERGNVIFGSGDDVNVNISRLFEWRRDQLSKLPGRQAKQVFENEVDNLIESELSNVLEKDAVTAWRKANEGYRDFSVKWDSGDLISRLVQKDRQGAKLRYSPEKTANLLFNVSDAGIINKEGVGQAIGFLRTMRDEGKLTESSWRELQGEAMHRLLRFDNNFKEVQNRVLIDGKGQQMVEVNGVQLRKAWNAAKQSISKELEDLFGPEFIPRMDNFTQHAVLMDAKMKSPTDKQIDPISKILVRVGQGIGNATFTMKRMLSREGAKTVQRTAEVRAAEAMHGPFFAPQEVNFPRVAAGEFIENGNEEWWSGQYNNILSDINSMWDDDATDTP